MAELELPVKGVPLDSNYSATLSREMPQFRDALIRGDPGGFLMGKTFWDAAKEIYNMKVRPDDTWVVTFPKCGTTWTQEMVWLISNNCDFEAAKVPLVQRSPFLEASLIIGSDASILEEIMKMMPGVQEIDEMPSPRYIKSHLPFNFLPPNLLEVAKVVYVSRNPKDVITSYYYHHKLIKQDEYKGTMEQFAELFMRGDVMYGSFLNHAKDAWEKRDHPNLHYIFYEDMKKDLRSEIRKLASFLNKSITEEQTNALLEHLSFKSFKENPAVNAEFLKEIGIGNPDSHFVRKGETGDWKNHFSVALNARLDKWIAENLANTTLAFCQEL